tara:strand:+ start:1358 stop:1558 length:201 start_codon:yes stop_codon:yes gene_type:complete
MDIACGEGDLLKIIIKYPFMNICGFEISETLSTICQRNMKKINDKIVNIYNLDVKDFKKLPTLQYI